MLAVLARTHAPLTGFRVHELAGRSYARVRLVLQRLVEHGLVLGQRHGSTNSYTLNREHVLVPPLLAMLGATATIEDEVRSGVASWSPAPAAVVLFGSFARRDGNAGSDVDLLVVRPEAVDEEDPGWIRQRAALTAALERRSGNRVQVVELSGAEFLEAVAGDEPLVSSLRADGVVLAGSNAVLAAIAAADAICCAAAGSRFRGPDHRDAAAHLEAVTGDPRLSTLLRDVVELKDLGHYGLGNVVASRARSAVRKAGQLVKEAERRTRGAPPA